MLKKIIGKRIYLKSLEISDYKILFNLRKKKNFTKYLNKISRNPLDQKVFIKNEINKKNFLFGIYNYKKKFLGTISLYNISKKKESEWGRWICIGNQKQSLESIVLILNFGYEHLNLVKIFSRTLSENLKVINIHNRLGFKMKGENFNDFFIKKKYHNSIVHVSEKKNYKKIIKNINKIINF